MRRSVSGVVAGYTLVPAPPPVDDYLRLRLESGLTPRSRPEAERALAGTWWGCHVVHDHTGETVAMGRVIGDGGWYFHVADMATLPEHQRRGLGDLVLGSLLDRIKEGAAGARPFVCLMADPPGRRLYARHGFTEDRDASVGMALWLE